MKKTAIFGIAIFYLLLTTGMFVCIVHCSAEYFVNKHPKGHNEQDELANHKKKPCGKDENCTCCKTHDEFVIKENFRAPGITYTAVSAVLPFYLPAILLIPNNELFSVLWPKGNGPPLHLKGPLFIFHRSLLI